jgi:ADP-ribose pyrophosphatase YjhB (NUDIX family)
MANIRTPLVATDVVAEYCGGVVVITRRNPPLGFALPGGFLELGLSLEDNARKEFGEETGLQLRIDNPGHPYTYSTPGRDPRFAVISCTFYGVASGTLCAGDDAASVSVIAIEELPHRIADNSLAFDHAQILGDWLARRAAGWR